MWTAENVALLPHFGSTELNSPKDQPLGCLGGSVVEHLSTFGSGRGPGVLGSGPASGSPWGVCFSLCLFLCLSLSLMNEQIKPLKKKSASAPQRMPQILAQSLTQVNQMLYLVTWRKIHTVQIMRNYRKWTIYNITLEITTRQSHFSGAE